MARLMREGSTEERMLLVRNRIGRARENELAFEEPWVSTAHAYLVWNGRGAWELRDLGSRNGTYVNGRALPEGERRVLRRGTRVAFGNPAFEWCMTDDGPPSACARNLSTHQLVFREDQMLSLPGHDGVNVAVYENGSGQWVAEVGGEPQLVQDGESLFIGGEVWRLMLPNEVLPTTDLATAPTSRNVEALGGASLRFQVSRDLEHVQFTIRTPSRLVFSSERVYAQVLWLLSRARLEDRRLGLPEADQGWVYVDDLRRQLAFDSENRVNVEVHRARQELARAGVPGAPGIVERRRGTRQLRIGTASVEVDDVHEALP